LSASAQHVAPLPATPQLLSAAFCCLRFAARMNYGHRYAACALQHVQYAEKTSLDALHWMR